MKKYGRKKYYPIYSTPYYKASSKYSKYHKYPKKYASQYDKPKKDTLERATAVTIPGKRTLPDIMYTRFVYAEKQVLHIPDLNYRYQYMYRMNSLYDPNYSGGGNQPFLRDQLLGTNGNQSALYTRYKITHCKIETVWMPFNSNSVPMYCYVIPMSSGQLATGIPNLFYQVAELPFCKKELLGTYSGGDSQKRIDHYMSIAKIDGVTKQQFDGDDDQYAADGGANPNTSPGWVIAFESADGSSTGAVYIDIKITYYGMIYDLNQNIGES